MPAAAVIIPAVIAAGVGVAQTTSANKQAKKLQNQINEYDRQQLTNPYESLQVSTLGTDRLREDLARNISTVANTAAQGGSRAINSLVPNVIAQQFDAEQKIMANLDEQEKERQRLIAQGNSVVQQMQENREQQDLLGLGNALNVANQNRVNGINLISQAFMGIAQGASSGMFGGSSNKSTNVGQLSSISQSSAPQFNFSAPQMNIPQYTGVNPGINFSQSTIQQPTYNPFATPQWMLGLNGQKIGL